MATSDSQAALARWHHRASQALLVQAERERDARNAAIRALRASDPERWSYRAIAQAVGCSPELVAAVLKGRLPKSNT